MEKLGNFVAVKTLDSTAWAKLHRGFWVEGKSKERAIVYQVPQAIQAPDKFPHHLAVLDVLHHEIAKGELLFGHKYIAGFPLSMVLARCDRDGFPLPLDHALLIMERVLSGWEDYKLGLPHPFLIWMTFDGEVKCSVLPLPRAFPRWKHDELLPWLSPQLIAGQEWERPDQVWAAGALFFQLLTGRVLPASESDDERVAAILQTPAMAEGPIPKDLQMILLKALASKSEERYQHIRDMREELGQLIYSGAYTPTTFNLAFFMHTLFREEADGEEKVLEKEDALDLAPILAPPPPPKPAEPPSQAASQGPARPAPSFAQIPEAEPEAKKSPGLFIGLAAAAVVLVAAGVFFLRGGEKPAPTPQGPTPAELQRQADMAAQLEEYKAKMEELEATAAQNKEELEKLQKVQKEGKKSPEIEKEIERKRQEVLEAEQRREQMKKEMDQKKEPAPAAPAGGGPPPVTGTAATPPAPASTVPGAAPPSTPPVLPGPGAPAGTTTPTPIPASADPTPAKPVSVPAKPVPSVKEGELVSISEVDSPPVPMKKVNPDFPPIARMKKITGKVTLKVLVSEKGKPEQVEVVTISPSSATNVGFDKAAVEAVKKWEFQPATKDGIRVKCWFLVPVVFD